MKLFAFFIFLFYTQLVFFSQEINNNQNTFTASLDFEFNPTQIYEQNGIIIIAQLENCNNPSVGMEKDYIYFNIKNTNSFAVKFSFEQNLYFNNSCKTCEKKEEYSKDFVLKPNEVLSSSCNDLTSKSFKIFYGSPWVSEKLSKFVLKNIKIEKQ
ncbi:hypothetical protein N9335_02510 [Crocinitomicaceae bacterium]|nr:hypothetical protein [Crocinitomicaceae bacterium]